MALETNVRNGIEHFAGEPVREGTDLRLSISDFVFDGTVEQVEGSPTVRRQTVVLKSRMSSERAGELAPSDTVWVGGRDVATIRDAAGYPTGRPNTNVVFLAVNLTGVQRGGELTSGGTPLRRGQQIRLDTGECTVTGTVDRVGGGLVRRPTEVLITDTVDAETAERPAAGDHIRVAGETTARLRTSPSTVRMIRIVNGLPSGCRCRLSSTAAGHGSAPPLSAGGTTSRSGPMSTTSRPTPNASGPRPHVGRWRVGRSSFDSTASTKTSHS